jgi:phosphate-selective porin OprO/OprP
VANAVGSTTNIIDTGFINYGYNQAGQVRVGRFKQPFSLEENTSSNNIDFMERSYVNQITPGKKLGAMIHGANDAGFTYAVSVFQEGFDELTNREGSGKQGALRVTGDLAKLAKMGEGNTVVHLGLGATKGSYEILATTTGNTTDTLPTTTRGTILSFRDENRGLSNSYRLQIQGDKITSSGFNYLSDTATNINKNMQGLEIAIANGPFKFQSEYANSEFGATHSKCEWSAKTCLQGGTAKIDADVKTKYLELMWNITGEDFAKAYSKGAFGGIKPTSEFMKDYGGVIGNGTGAWQIGYRYSTYDVAVKQANANTTASSDGVTTQKLQDGSSNSTLAGGSANNSRYQNSPSAKTNTLGVNWILNSNARVMFNFARTDFGSPVEYLDTDGEKTKTTKKEDIISVRTQINF